MGHVGAHLNRARAVKRYAGRFFGLSSNKGLPRGPVQDEDIHPPMERELVTAADLPLAIRPAGCRPATSCRRPETRPWARAVRGCGPWAVNGEVRDRVSPVGARAHGCSRSSKAWTPKVTQTVLMRLRTASERTPLDNLAEFLTIEMERETPGVRPAAVGDSGPLAGFPATGSDASSDESEMPRSFVLHATDPGFVVVAGCHALGAEREGTPQTPKGVQLGLGQHGDWRSPRSDPDVSSTFLRQTPSSLPGYR